MNISETLLRTKAKEAARHIAEGGTAEGFEQLWRDGGESSVLAILHDAGACTPDKSMAEMTYSEKAALRDTIGDEAYVARLRSEGVGR